MADIQRCDYWEDGKLCLLAAFHPGAHVYERRKGHSKLVVAPSGRIMATHTYAVLEVSRAAYDEIKDKLEVAGYSDQFHKDGDSILVDMHGIALKIEPASEPKKPLVLIVALNPQLAEVAAKRLGLKHPWEWKSVVSEDELRGLAEPEVVLAGAWTRRKDADAIQTQLHICRARISKMELR